MPSPVRVLSRSVDVAAAPDLVWELVADPLHGDQVRSRSRVREAFNAASIEQTLERVKARAERQD